MKQTQKLNDVNPLMMPLLAALETGINQLFAMDPETFALLSGFKGRIIAFHFIDVKQLLYFFVDQQGIQVIANYEGEADTIISGSLFAFARMAIADEKTKTGAVFNGDINISGDIALGQHFQSLFKQLDIDWEEHLSHITGDVIAHSLGNLTRSFLGWGRQSLNSLTMNMSEYIQYESRDVASAPEIHHFNQQIDHLRSDVDRAEARLKRLLQAAQTESIISNSADKKPVE